MIKMDFEQKEKISYTFLRVIYSFLGIDKKARYYGTDVQLSHAEIHMIKAIKANEEIHITGLANQLGVTKGAVSQIAGRLEKKGLLIKEKDIYNQSKLILRLTAQGEIAHHNHENYHNHLDALIEEALKDASAENISFLKRFLDILENRLDRFEDNFTK